MHASNSLTFKADVASSSSDPEMDASATQVYLTELCAKVIRAGDTQVGLREEERNPAVTKAVLHCLAALAIVAEEAVHTRLRECVGFGASAVAAAGPLEPPSTQQLGLMLLLNITSRAEGAPRVQHVRAVCAQTR